jgi:hypothetical protein
MMDEGGCKKTEAAFVRLIASLATRDAREIGRGLVPARCPGAKEVEHNGSPLHVMAGGAQTHVPIYDTEGGWLNFTPQELVDHAKAAREKGFRGVKVKVGRPHVVECPPSALVGQIRQIKEGSVSGSS